MSLRMNENMDGDHLREIWRQGENDSLEGKEKQKQKQKNRKRK